ncbi:collagenase-like [Ostrinia nubilalis]|uniref:collagenase-like n=1 Tax=Ostrinia nubilalis TaxID=29057 RepID=UPI0030822962
MKYLVVLLSAITAIYAMDLARLAPEGASVYGYLTNIGIPEAERLQKAEEEYLAAESGARIINGQPSQLGFLPYQAGLVVSIVGVVGVSLCGGALVSNNRVLTAAHCWFDGTNQASMFTVVLGSVTVFSGGTKIETSSVVSHPEFSVNPARNDIAVIHLPQRVSTTSIIAPIALPSGTELYESFSGNSAIASGFGMTSRSGSLTLDQFLNYVTLPVISNTECLTTYPSTLQTTHICTDGEGPRGTCHGDSGGPLAVFRNNRWILIGLSSFGPRESCEAGLPTVFTRVTSYMTFIYQNL